MGSPGSKEILETQGKPAVRLDKNGKPLRGCALNPNKLGRPKGSPNKIRRDVAELVRIALEGVGDETYLIARAKKNPTAFLALVSKLMPTQINADVNVNSDLAARLAAAELRTKTKE